MRKKFHTLYGSIKKENLENQFLLFQIINNDKDNEKNKSENKNKNENENENENENALSLLPVADFVLKNKTQNYKSMGRQKAKQIA